MEEKTNENESHWSGKPMSEESYKDWQKSFSDIEDCIKELYGN